MKYPRFVFKNGGTHLRHGGSYESKLVADDGEMIAAINDGWFRSLPEAIESKHSVETESFIDSCDSNPEISRDELEAKAKELGIKFDGRTSDVKLLEKIEEAINQAGEE